MKNISEFLMETLVDESCKGDCKGKDCKDSEETCPKCGKKKGECDCDKGDEKDKDE